MNTTPIDALPKEVEIQGIYDCNGINIDGEFLPLYPSLNIVNHSPDGFSWGYCGSGPAQLALAILLHFLPVRVALEYYQDFKNEHVAAWPEGEDFTIRLKLREAVRKIVIRPIVGERC